MALKHRILKRVFDRYFRWRLPELLKPGYPVVFDYVDFPIATPAPRYGFGKPPHARLYEIINAGRSEYAHQLRRLCRYRDSFSRIPATQQPGGVQPHWANSYFSDLDAMALYGLLADRNPRQYVEVGSGNSTKFARRAITDQGLRTRIISIDPMPRTEIKEVADEVKEVPLEKLDLSIFDEIDAGDFLFIDNSHLAMANSDVTTFFLDVFPRLKPGLVVHLHDILLPYDYPPEWSRRYYSEQYLLACFLLATPEESLPRMLFASAFISQDDDLNELAAEVCAGTNLEVALESSQPARRWTPPHRGLSIWIETK